MVAQVRGRQLFKSSLDSIHSARRRRHIPPEVFPQRDHATGSCFDIYTARAHLGRRVFRWGKRRVFALAAGRPLRTSVGQQIRFFMIPQVSYPLGLFAFLVIAVALADKMAIATGNSRWKWVFDYIYLALIAKP